MDINSICLQNPNPNPNPNLIPNLNMVERSPPPPNQPRKRRRPALSCVQCRRRKIKCDRNMPCGQCTAAKTPSCHYTSDPTPPSKKARVDGQFPVTPSSIGQASPGDSSNISRGGMYDGLPNTFQENSPWAMRQPVPNGPRVELNPDYQPIEPRSEHNSVQGLLDRVHKLEKLLSDSQSVAAGLAAAPRMKTPSLRGSLSKSRFFGQSHWVNSFEQFKQVSNFKDMNSLGKKGEIFNLLNKCKAIGRTTKANQALEPCMPAGYRDFVPDKPTCDRLIAAYFRTVESVFRILHMPTFEEEYATYWKNPTVASVAFVVELLLVMAIGSCFYEDPILPTSLHWKASQWIAAAQGWISAPGEKSRLNIKGLQIHCLLLIARQTSAYGADLTWISAGSVFHLAMSLGLHRDPIHFPKIGPCQAEIRRRLWATVLELSLQSSQDLGMPPMISHDEYDTELPANIDDADINENTKEPPTPKPITTFTQTSVQLSLMRTFNIRLDIAKAINSLRNDTSYEETLRLGSALAIAARSGSALLQSFLASSSPRRPTPFHIKLHDFYTNHFLLSIHRPYAVKARVNPTYYFSRKVCLETALSLISPALQLPSDHPNSDESPDDWSLLWYMGGGVIQGNGIHCYCTLALELIHQFEENPPVILPSMASAHEFTPQQAQIFRMLSDGREWAKNRIIRGQTNVKGHVFLSCLCGQIEAMRKGDNSQEGIAEEARMSVEICWGLLKERQEREMAVRGGDKAVGMGMQNIVGGEGGAGSASGVDNVDWEVVMREQGAAMNFDGRFDLDMDIPDEWIFSGWEDSNSWV